jgi:hypothetical protein
MIKLICVCVCVCVCDVCGCVVCGSLSGKGKGAKREGYRRREEMVQHVTVECGIMRHIKFHRIASQGFITQCSTLECRTSHFNIHNANCASQRKAFRFRILRHGAAHHGTFSTVQPT